MTTTIHPETIRELSTALNALEAHDISVRAVSILDDGGYQIHINGGRGDVDPSGIGGGTIKSLDGE